MKKKLNLTLKMSLLDLKEVLYSRSEVNLERTFTFKNSGQTWRGVPLMSSNMDTVSSFEMFYELQKNKCITCFLSILILKIS